jgi:hypothetical protein
VPEPMPAHLAADLAVAAKGRFLWLPGLSWGHPLLRQVPKILHCLAAGHIHNNLRIQQLRRHHDRVWTVVALGTASLRAAKCAAAGMELKRNESYVPVNMVN